MSSINARLRKLEMQHNMVKHPAVLILYDRDGVLLDSDGEPFSGDIPSTALVIKFQMPTDDGAPSGRMIDPWQWSQQVAAEQRARDAAARPQQQPPAAPVPVVAVLTADERKAAEAAKTEEVCQAVMEAERQRLRKKRGLNWK